MLIRFQAENYRSLSAPVELSMVAVDRDRPEARDQDPLGESLVPVAAIYGPNATGKSNVVAALAWLRAAVAWSLRSWDDGIPIDPFAFANGPREPVKFELELTVKGVRFEYLLELDQDKVLYEALFHYPLRYRRRVFEREAQQLRFGQGVTNQAGIRELLTPRVLVLSVARRFQVAELSRFVAQVLEMQVVGQLPPRTMGRLYRPIQMGRLGDQSATLRLFETDVQEPLFGQAPDEGAWGSGARDRALAMLRLADLGIDDVLIDYEEIGQTGNPRPVRRRVHLLHGVAGAQEPLDLDQESAGTIAWFGLIGPSLQALHRGAVLIVDEIDASLHPRLSAELIRIFHSPDLNSQGAQLVFTAHDTSLMSALNRDEIWLTDKRDDGSTVLGSLAEFAGERVRKSINFQAGYLSGRFGAVPQLDRADLLRALGVIG